MTINSLLNSINHCNSNVFYLKNKIYKEIKSYFNLFINLPIKKINLKEQKLIQDMTIEIFNQINKGYFKLEFDLQYTNPGKKSTNPGSPLQFLSDEGHKWFRELGFETKDIIDCCGKSSSCDFGCKGDGICKVLIKWSKKENYSKEKLNAGLCYELSNIMYNYKKIQNII